MAKKKRLDTPVTLFVLIEADAHEALRAIAHENHRSMSAVVRDALSEYFAQRNAAITETTDEPAGE